MIKLVHLLLMKFFGDVGWCFIIYDDVWYGDDDDDDDDDDDWCSSWSWSLWCGFVLFEPNMILIMIIFSQPLFWADRD